MLKVPQTLTSNKNNSAMITSAKWGPLYSGSISKVRLAGRKIKSSLQSLASLPYIGNWVCPERQFSVLLSDFYRKQQGAWWDLFVGKRIKCHNVLGRIAVSFQWVSNPRYHSFPRLFEVFEMRHAVVLRNFALVWRQHRARCWEHSSFFLHVKLSDMMATSICIYLEDINAYLLT